MRNLIGCSREFFKQYISSKFKNGMSWNNYGKIWNLDHIIPTSRFDLTSPDEQKICFNYINYQPLYLDENVKKSDKVDLGKIEVKKILPRSMEDIELIRDKNGDVMAAVKISKLTKKQIEKRYGK